MLSLSAQTEKNRQQITAVTGSELVSGYAPGIPDVHAHREADPRAAEETTRSWIREQTGLEMGTVHSAFESGAVVLISALAFSGTLQPAEAGYEIQDFFSPG
ncbi:hypothetical protein [Enterobacter sp. 22466]|uniref:hypothetical protein n=1 Tax=Enterobacter sp. 22466 TaxID=3453924 RepID=UPI003F87D1A1